MTLVQSENEKTPRDQSTSFLLFFSLEHYFYPSLFPLFNFELIFLQLLRKCPERRLGAGEKDAEEIKIQPFFKVGTCFIPFPYFLCLSWERFPLLVLRLLSLCYQGDVSNSFCCTSFLHSRICFKSFLKWHHPSLFSGIFTLPETVYFWLCCFYIQIYLTLETWTNIPFKIKL